MNGKMTSPLSSLGTTRTVGGCMGSPKNMLGAEVTTVSAETELLPLTKPLNLKPW